MSDTGSTTHDDGGLETHGRSARARVALLERRAAGTGAHDPVEAALMTAAAVDLRRRGAHALRMARIRGADPDVDVVDTMLEHLDVAIGRYVATAGRESAGSGGRGAAAARRALSGRPTAGVRVGVVD
jgi:hypothetical protein